MLDAPTWTAAMISLTDVSAVAGIIDGEDLGNYAVAYGYRQSNR